MVKRAFRWNIRTNTGEQERLRYRYTVAVVNAPREIDNIREKMFRQLATADDLTPISDYPIENSNGLHCRIFSFSSEVGTIRKPEQIYDNPPQFRLDRALKEKSETEMIPYIERLVASLS